MLKGAVPNPGNDHTAIFAVRSPEIARNRKKRFSGKKWFSTRRVFCLVLVLYQTIPNPGNDHPAIFAVREGERERERERASERVRERVTERERERERARERE